MRLFAPRHGPIEAGLLPHGRGVHAELLGALLDGLVDEVDGAPVRQVRLAEEGIHFLIRNLRPDQRPRQVREASPLYQSAMLRAWRDEASPGERDVVEAVAERLYGDLMGDRRAQPASLGRARGEELVLSWTRTEDPGVRQGLARAMRSLGLREVGEVGDTASFDARRHTSADSLFPGDSARIVEAGWALASPDGDTVLLKATVKPSEGV